MLLLHYGSGASDFSIAGDSLSEEQARRVFQDAIRLLRARGERDAEALVRTIPFHIGEASNHFGDELSMLFATVPLERYEQLRRAQDDDTQRLACRCAAKVISEIGPSIRFIAVELASTAPEGPRTSLGSCIVPGPFARVDWASLLRRVYLEDVLACPSGGRRRILADVTDPAVVAAILHHLDLPEAPPTVRRARDLTPDAA